MSDKFHFGWQDGQFVMLVVNGAGAVKNHISLNLAEAIRVREQLHLGRETEVVTFEHHEQIDSPEPLVNAATRWEPHNPIPPPPHALPYVSVEFCFRCGEHVSAAVHIKNQKPADR